MTEPTTPPTPKSTNPIRASIATIVIVSFLTGGVAGGVFGTLASSGGLSSLLGNRSNSITQSSGSKSFTFNEESDMVDLVKNVNPAVVSIVAKKDYGKVYGTDQSSPLDNFFFGFPFFQQPQPQGKQEVGGGSGFLITSDGIVLTNKHVIEIDADEFTVVLNDGKTYDATILAKDPTTDIAFLKIDARDVPTVELGDSDSIEVGQTVIAIGNALGEYRNTVTKGIISGLARTITAGDNSGNSETLRNVIQTDAAINLGNSGGPLVNAAGQAIGINTAISQQGQLIGFALPINLAKADLESIQKNGKIERPYLGVRYVLINQQIKETNKLDVDYGALVVRGTQSDELAVVPGSPADKAGIVENDIVLEVDGQKITEEYDLAQALQEKTAGQTVKLKVKSKGEDKELEVKLENRSE